MGSEENQTSIWHPGLVNLKGKDKEDLDKREKETGSRAKRLQVNAEETDSEISIT